MKCKICGEKIRYNSWKTVNGETYCMKCFEAIPKKPKRKYRRRKAKKSD
jgi:formylmethanofuran dehydrogenase subunit E